MCHLHYAVPNYYSQDPTRFLNGTEINIALQLQPYKPMYSSSNATEILPVHVNESWGVVPRLSIEQSVVIVHENQHCKINDTSLRYVKLNVLRMWHDKTLLIPIKGKMDILTLHTRVRSLKGSRGNDNHNAPPLSPKLSLPSTATALSNGAQWWQDQQS